MKSYFYKLRWTIFIGFIFYVGYSITSSLFPMMSQQLFDHYGRGTGYLQKLLLIFILLVIVNLICEYFNRVWEWRLSKQFKVMIKQALFSKFISKDSEQFKKEKPAAYLTIINNNIDVLDEDYLSATIDLVKSIGSLIIFSISMIYVLDVRITGIIVVSSILIAVMPTLTQKKLAKLRKNHLTEAKHYNDVLIDLLEGYKYVTSKTIGVIRKRHGQQLMKTEEKHFLFGRFRVMSDMINSIGTNVMNVLVFAASGLLLIQGNISIGAASAALLYTGKLIGSIANVLSCINVLNSSKDIVAEMEEQLKLPEKEEDLNNIPNVSSFKIEDLQYSRDNFELKLAEVFFEKGNSYAVTGSSGAGKSTFLRIINGEIVPQQMSMQVKPSVKDVREAMFTLQQKEHLFDTDFYSNVTLFNSFPLNSQVDEVLNLLDSKLHNRLTHYDSIEELSGGERQIISILRMLNLGYPINLLDEPFAGIDTKVKERLLAFLLQHNIGILIEVTHDVSEKNLGKYTQTLQIKDGTII